MQFRHRTSEQSQTRVVSGTESTAGCGSCPRGSSCSRQRDLDFLNPLHSIGRMQPIPRPSLVSRACRECKVYPPKLQGPEYYDVVRQGLACIVEPGGHRSEQRRGSGPHLVQVLNAEAMQHVARRKEGDADFTVLSGSSTQASVCQPYVREARQSKTTTWSDGV